MTSIEQRKNAPIAILIYPLAGNLKSLANDATSQLERDGFGKVVDIESAARNLHDSCRIILIEDRYHKSCHNLLATKQICFDHHLILTDLGLEEDAELIEENIELIKDGIEAECVVKDSYPPQFNCPCGNKL